MDSVGRNVPITAVMSTGRCCHPAVIHVVDLSLVHLVDLSLLLSSFR